MFFLTSKNFIWYLIFVTFIKILKSEWKTFYVLQTRLLEYIVLLSSIWSGEDDPTLCPKEISSCPILDGSDDNEIKSDHRTASSLQSASNPVCVFLVTSTT